MTISIVLTPDPTYAEKVNVVLLGFLFFFFFLRGVEAVLGLGCGVWALEHSDSVVSVCGLSHPAVCGILVP